VARAKQEETPTVPVGRDVALLGISAPVFLKNRNAVDSSRGSSGRKHGRLAFFTTYLGHAGHAPGSRQAQQSTGNSVSLNDIKDCAVPFCRTSAELSAPYAA